MASMLDMVTEIVAAHASSSRLSTEELLIEIEQVHSTLAKLDQTQPAEAAAEDRKPAMTLKQAFKKDEVVCLLCGKGKMKTLTRHLAREHGVKPGEYRKQFGIPRTQALTAKSFSDERRTRAKERGLGDILVKAREARATKAKAKEATQSKSSSAKPKSAAKSSPVRRAQPA